MECVLFSAGPILVPTAGSTAGGCSLPICGMNKGKNYLKIGWFKPPFHFLWTILFLFPFMCSRIYFFPTLTVHYKLKTP